jgi:hypothetical protein
MRNVANGDRTQCRHRVIALRGHGLGTAVAQDARGGYPMAKEKRVTETKTKNDSFGDPKETKTTSKETKVDSSGNKQETKTEYKAKR